MPERYQFPFDERYLEFEGLKLHYVDEGTGTPVVLVHGQPTWGYVYRKVVPPLVAEGYRCVVPDLIGFGLSDKPSDESAYTVQKHVRSVAALVEALELHGVIVVGHDWGAHRGILRLDKRAADLQNRYVALSAQLES